MDAVLGLLVRITVTYVYLLVLLRLAGKRTIGHSTPFDLLVAVLVGDMPDDVIWGDVPVAQGLLAMGVVMTLHVVVSAAAARFPAFERLVCAVPSVAIRNGRPSAKVLRRERVSELELAMLLRLASTRPAEIRTGRFEPSGALTLIRRLRSKPAQRRDRDWLRRLVA